MTRTCFPFVRYTLNTPIPLADIPRLKNRACTENLGESGSNRIANGSSNDSSMSRNVNELSTLNGGLLQSNSISELTVNQSPLQCLYFVFTCGNRFVNKNLNFSKNQPPETSGGWLKTFSYRIYSFSPFPPPVSMFCIMSISGKNIAITMLPTITARKTIITGSRSEVMADTALSTSSS